ncbi:protein transport protein sft2 [Ascosphaera acerosa]|nr:protein transport protein sft2 [Ascosphaera acerosa]
MASASFRESMNSLGWSRRSPSLPPPSTAPISGSSSNGGDGGSFLSSLRSINPFNAGGSSSYIQLPSSEPGSSGRTNRPPPAASAPPIRDDSGSDGGGLLALSRWDRLLIFAGCNVGAAVCFGLCLVFLFFPVLLTRPRKFAALWSLGSALFLGSWAALMGVAPYVRHLLSGPRLPFTAVYFGSIAGTLYFALGLHSTLLLVARRAGRELFPFVDAG